MKALFICLGFVPLFAISQEAVKKIKCELGFDFQMQIDRGINLQGHWNEFAPDFVEPTMSDTAYKTNSYNGYSSSMVRPNVYFQVKIPTRFERFSLVPRFNYTMGSGLNSYQYWFKSSSYNTDTLTSSKTGAMYFLDSTVTNYKSCSVYGDAHIVKLGVSGNYQFGKRFYCFAGVDFGLNLSSKTYFRTSESEYSTTETAGNGYITVDFQYDESKTKAGEGHANKVNSSMISVPIGIKMCLGTKDNLWSHLYVSYEYFFSKQYFKTSTDFKFSQNHHTHALRLSYQF